MMQDAASNNQRIAKNTIILYIRMIIIVVVGLYTSRVVLSTLGVEDFGIYGVVGGIVAMMGFLNASMSGATSRFLTYELGVGNVGRISRTFSTAMVVHIIIAVIVLIAAESLGLWILESKLVIPQNRISAAHRVFQLSVASAMLSIIQVPYNASIIAHERMNVYAYIEMLNVTLKLLIVFCLTVWDFDKLVFYAWLYFGVNLVIMLIYRFYCVKLYKECRFHWIWDKAFIAPLLSFTGWDLYGNGCVTVRQQGTNFLINMFYGVAYNAASSVATTAQGMITGLAANVIMAFRPQIIKNYANGDFAQMQKLSCNAIKYVILLFGCMAIPFILDMQYVMELWLGQVPEKAVIFCKVQLLWMFLVLANNVFIICIHATGNIKRISLITGSIHLLTLPAIYYLFLMGFPAEFAYIATLIAGIIVDVSNILILKRQIPDIEIESLVLNWVRPMIALLVIAIFPLLLNLKTNPSFLRFMSEIACTVIAVFVYVYLWVLTPKQKEFVKGKVSQFLVKQ